MRELKMTISLNVIEHLGMNLYSTIPAVLSEIVANSWDADASCVKISLDKTAGKIAIQDDGCGMTRDEVIDRFLSVGFHRRKVLGELTPRFGRRPMGRKGIGKLSSFSIANTIDVHTTRNEETTAFRMDARKIKTAIQEQANGVYQPTELQYSQNMPAGTRIVLTNLKQAMTKMTVGGLRQRLARRFSIIGPTHNFRIFINDEEIEAQDRGYHRHVEYLWTYNLEAETRKLFANLAEGRPPIDRTSSTVKNTEDSGIQVSGWIGTVRNPGFLKGEGNANLNHIAIFMRGKLAQEDILRDFGQKEIYADYVVGEIHCDDLDRDEDDDIATSSRQSLKYDDSRFEAVRETVHQEIRHIAGQWSAWRRSDGTKTLMNRVPEVREWLEGLQGDTKKKAEMWIGRLNVIRSDKDTERRELLKASILAFESYRRKQQLDFLGKISDQNIEPILEIFSDIDDLELSYYGQIVKLRLGIITTLEERLDNNDKEIVIQNHIYNHLWLVDPSWERVKGTETMEKTLGNFLRQNTQNLTPEQRKARIDIGYRTASGRHVIIELKRSSVSTPVDDLARQIRKYRDGAKRLITQSNYADWPLDIICLVGSPPPEWNGESGRQDVQTTLASVDARLVFYDQLLDNARRGYSDYLERHKEIDKLWKIFQGIEDFSVSDSNENEG